MRHQFAIAAAVVLFGFRADRALVPSGVVASLATATEQAESGDESVATDRELAIEPADEELRAARIREAERGKCFEARQRILSEPALPGAPEFEKVRPSLLPRAKAEPVLFVRAPEAEATDNPHALAYRTRLKKATKVWVTLRDYFRRMKGFPEIGRQTLLREGYLYSENPDFAYSLVHQIRLEYLFDDPEVWIERGELRMRARRNEKGRYVYRSGPHEGERVRLLHLDRVFTGEPPPPLHRDVRSLRYRLHFDKMRVQQITADHIVAELRYSEHWVPVLLRTEGARVDLHCEIVPDSIRAAVKAHKEKNARQQRVVQALRHAMLDQMEEGLPFDEPKTEIGQEDGQLRNAWRFAYLEGRKTFKYNDDRYRVFDSKGRPKVPQVCTDFLTDTFERASGTWWHPQGEPPSRHIGRLDFKGVEGLALRQAWSLIEFAAKKSDWFELYTTPERDRVELGYKERFFRYLARKSHLYQPGDIVFIRGFTPWDDQEMHYHSFFVYETDPITAIPIAIVGNAGSPSIRTLEVEARRTPHRTIWYRIRPKLDWLESIIPPERELDESAPVLVRG